MPQVEGTVQLSDVTSALQRLDPIWEVLYPEQRRRVLELLVERITVSRERVEIRFRVNGIEQMVDELAPLGASTNGKD